MQKKLYKDTANKKVSGVCAGIAKYFDVDVTIIRLVWVFASIILGAGMAGLIAYVVCACIIPDEPDQFTGNGTYN